MGMFDDINNHRGTQGGVYFHPDHHYMVEIERCKLGKTRRNVDMFVAECKVIETDSDERKPGSVVSFLVTLDKDPALDNIADFARNGLWVLGRDSGMDDLPSKSDEIVLNDAIITNDICGEDNVLAGLRVGVFAYNKPTKAGNPFTRHRWMAPEEAQQNIALAQGHAAQ